MRSEIPKGLRAADAAADGARGCCRLRRARIAPVPGDPCATFYLISSGRPLRDDRRAALRSLAQPHKAERASQCLHWATCCRWYCTPCCFSGWCSRPMALYLGVGNSVSVIIWLTVLIYWLGSFFYRLQGLQVFVARPPRRCWCCFPRFRPVHPLTHTDLAAFSVHLLISLLAYSLFTIASLHALMMAVHGATPASRRASAIPASRCRRCSRWSGSCSASSSRDSCCSRLRSAAAFSSPRNCSASPCSSLTKTVFGILSWIIFGALLAGRHSTDGAAAWPCAGRWPASSRSCSPTSAASSFSR